MQKGDENATGYAPHRGCRKTWEDMTSESLPLVEGGRQFERSKCARSEEHDHTVVCASFRVIAKLLAECKSKTEGQDRARKEAVQLVLVA